MACKITTFRAVRFAENPIIHSGLHGSLGENINGPSLIRVPPWVRRPLSRYYLYFAHHGGNYIRMAYADNVRGPWTVYPPGALQLEATCCRNHIASPDVHVLCRQREIVMYFHGCTSEGQRSFRACSRDGLRFHAAGEILGPFYFRVFRHGGAWFAIAKRTDAPAGGVLLRSPDGIAKFEPGPFILPRMRHAAVLKTRDCLHIFYSRIGDCPERILVSTMPLSGNWRRWKPSAPQEVIKPELEYEGAALPLRPSKSGSAPGQVRELRDPAVWREAGKLYLLYSAAGETAICGAELFEAR